MQVLFRFYMCRLFFVLSVVLFLIWLSVYSFVFLCRICSFFSFFSLSSHLCLWNDLYYIFPLCFAFLGIGKTLAFLNWRCSIFKINGFSAIILIASNKWILTQCLLGYVTLDDGLGIELRDFSFPASIFCQNLISTRSQGAMPASFRIYGLNTESKMIVCYINRSKVFIGSCTYCRSVKVF